MFSSYKKNHTTYDVLVFVAVGSLVCCLLFYTFYMLPYWIYNGIFSSPQCVRPAGGGLEVQCYNCKFCFYAELWTLCLPSKSQFPERVAPLAALCTHSAAHPCTLHFSPWPCTRLQFHHRRVSQPCLPPECLHSRCEWMSTRRHSLTARVEFCQALYDRC